jgi:AcrR family transcriptional regulator
MPKETFYNLEPNKRHKIVRAAIREFTDHELHKARVSNIIKMAGIPRGSFYQYFEDIDDLYYYVIDQVFDDIFDEGRKHAKETDNLFEYVRRTFEIDMEGFRNDKRHQFIMNVLKSIGSNIEYLTHHNTKRIDYIRSVLQQLDLSMYRLKTEEEYIRLYEFLQNLKRNVIQKMMMTNTSKEDARKDLAWHLDIIEHGLLKQEEPHHA